MTAIAESLADFFPDFGVAATVGGVALTGHFENGYADALGIAGSAPSLLIVAADAPSVALGNAVVVGGASYTVAAVEPDGVGITRLRLAEV